MISLQKISCKNMECSKECSEKGTNGNIWREVIKRENRHITLKHIFAHKRSFSPLSTVRRINLVKNITKPLQTLTIGSENLDAILSWIHGWMKNCVQPHNQRWSHVRFSIKKLSTLIFDFFRCSIKISIRNGWVQYHSD